MRRISFALAALLSLIAFADAPAQSPTALPYTMTTLAGSSPMSATPGTPCPNMAAGAQSTDAYGDGCLAANAIFGAAGRGGVQVDAFGNVFVADDVSSVLHRIDPVSGILTKLAGAGTVSACGSAAQDSAGDGCIAATQTVTKSPRGIGIDPYGNVLVAGYGDNLVHVVCRSASPLCTAGQIGTMQLVAGCSNNASSSGTGGVGLDNVPALTTNAGACTPSLGEVDGPRGVTADIYGNVYFADTNSSRTRVVAGPLTSPYFSGNNPLYAALGVYYPSVSAGYAYTVVNTAGSGTSSGGTATTTGESCSVTTNSTTYSGAALDTYGDGCPLEFSSVKASSGYTSGVAVDAAGNMLFTDPTHGLRVFFVSNAGAAGAAMALDISRNNGGVTPQPGFIYMLAGDGSGSLSATPTPGNSTALADSTITKVAVSPHGDVFIGDSSKILFFDMNTGYVRLLFSSSANVTAGNYCNGSSGQQSLSAYSDACPASKSLFSNNSGLGVAVDKQGNLYLYDGSSNGSGMLVREVLAQGLAEQTLGTPLTQTFQLHLPESAASPVAGSTATLSATSDVTTATPSCTQNADNSVDCTVTATIMPSAAGARSEALSVALPSGSWQNPLATIALDGTVTGSVLTLDEASTTSSGTTTPLPPVTSPLFSSIAPAGVTLDGAGNVYTMDTGSGTIKELLQNSTVAVLSSSLPSNAGQIAVDSLGDVFAAGSGTPSIQELKVTGPPASANAPASFATTSISYTTVSGSTPAPAAVATDTAGNLFVADNQGSPASNAIYRLSLQPGSPQAQVTVATGFLNPVSLAADGAGNVYVADKGAGAVYKLAPTGTGTYTQTTLLSSITPAAVAVDAAGDVYIQDATSGSVLEVPASGPATVTILTGLSTPNGLAVDGQGNIYSSDAHDNSITEVLRGAIAYNFGTDESTVFQGVLGNAGTQAISGSNPVTNTTNFNVSGGSANGCSLTSSILGPLAAGQSCTLSAALVGAGSGVVTDRLSFVPAGSTVGSLSLSGTLQGTAIATSTAVSGPSPASPLYTPAGTEASFTVTVTPAAGASAPGGTVAVTIDSTTTNYSLTTNGTNGVASVTLSGLAAGPHTISAVYATSGSFTGSSSGPQSFTITQVATSVSWTPSATSAQVSQALGTGVLNAAASPAVPGTFVYTATPSGGSATQVDASSYLPTGSYSLAVTFYPNDSIDYASSTSAVASFSVTKADTTAVAGASTDVVAADGSGNFTTLSAALAALPTTGGTIYLKPGTYSGQNAISYPNVWLRGLGGDPTQVVLTAEDGAFSAPFVYPGSGPGNANASGDQGSSTLDVTKSAYIGNQPTAGNIEYTPNNFYAEYLTIQNTYNSDNVTTTTYNTSSGSCANSGPAQTLQALYNSGKQCNSQALALWIESDQAVLNNVNLISQQDTMYAGSQGCGATCTAARQYIWQGTITGDVDYLFGDAALVFDHTNLFTTWHGSSATGTETIEAQNKKFETGSANDYLSGYICNRCTLLSQSSGMTNLYYGRPYGPYSTWIMLNSFVDQVNPAGWIEFQGDTNLPTSTYAEFNTQPYTDPAPGTAPYPSGLFYEDAADIPGYTGTPSYVLTPTGGNTGAGVAGTRETTSQDPGTIESSNGLKTQLTAAQAAQYLPVTFLSNTVPAQNYPGFTANWNPVAALANAVNSFAATGDITLNSYGTSVTILGRPSTPGAGVIPTGTYQFLDGSNVIASGTLDASGEAYFTTSTLTAGKHPITMVYGGDANFNGSTSAPVTITVPSVPLTPTSTTLTVSTLSITYGGSLSGTVSVAPQSGTGTPGGTISFYSGSTLLGSCTLSSGACAYSLTGVAAGVQTITAHYNGDSTFAASVSGGSAINVARAILEVSANSYVISVGAALPAYAATLTGFVNGDSQASATTGSPALSSTAISSADPATYPITVTTGTLAAANYTFSFSNGYLRVVPSAQTPAVATGDGRTVTEPSFPAVCQQLTANIQMVNNDIPTPVDATVTNPDGARIQAALNACSGTGQAVELSIGSLGNSAFLSGPLSMPSNVTLLVDPGVVLFFSRNVQDYDITPGTHTCGTVNDDSATSSCKPLIDIPRTSTNVGIMGYGKLDGRGGDTLIHPFPSSYQGQSWWGLSAIADSGGSQQNPRFIQMDTGASNITLYKITIRNSPLFHVSTTGAVNGFTAWDVKVVTPTTARNTDGIDPGNATNFTITRSWVSDGDDNVAIGASGSAPSANISVTNNHFFAGHGESIGSITEAGVSNVLFDGNMLWGNSSVDSNSTGIRIKSANDRGGLVTNIQYSNSCFQDHNALIQFTPLYDTNTGTQTPNFTNILLQNLDFLSAGSVQFTGADNPSTGTVYPLQVTLDNVNFDSLSSSNFVTSGSAGTETNAQLTYGPGDVSSNFINAWAAFAGSNGDTATNDITAASLYPPQCSFTAIAPELTGPHGLPQTITYGDNATAVVILTPAVGGAADPTGTVTLTDALTGNTTTATLSGDSDTLFVPLSGLSVGTHTFTATYSGDSNYVPAAGQPYSTTNPYVIVVNPGSLAATTTTLSGVPAAADYGSSFTATASVAGANPTGSVEFVVNGVVYASAGLSSGSASANISLAYSTTPYSIEAIYSGDTANAGSTSAASQVNVQAALTTTLLAASATTTALGHSVVVTATVSSPAGTPAGTVSFSYTTSGDSTPVNLTTSTLANGVAVAAINLPLGADSVTGTYTANGSFGGSVSSPMAITVNPPIIVPLPSSPFVLPYTMTTIAGGASSNCSSATDSYGNGCPGTAMAFKSGDDLRSLDADPFGNVYLTDASASEIRRIAPNGVITNFAGFVSGTSCVPTATTSCIPTQVKLNKPRGVSADAAGNIYIAGYSDNKAYKVSVTTGQLSLVAGTGIKGTPLDANGDGGPATSATLSGPRGIWADSLGNIYIADTGDNKIREVNSTAGTIQTIAGTGVASSTGDNGPATSATINNPQGVLVDPNFNVYIADSATVRAICVTCGTDSPLDNLLGKLGITAPANGDIYTIAGGASSPSTSYPTLATHVAMSPQKLAMDVNGNLYISDGHGVAWFLDAHTAAIRPIAGASSTNCSSETDIYGDGCPATQAIIGDNGNGIGVGTDALGNVYVSDTLNLLIRKITTNLSSPPTPVAASVAQPIELHFIPGDTPATTNSLAIHSPEWSLSAPACATNADNTTDCLLTSTFTPAVPGSRSTPLAVTSANGNVGYFGLIGVGLGAGATLDPASQSTFGSGLSVAGIAADNSGNVYVSDSTSKQLLRYTPAAIAQGSSATGTPLASLQSPGAVAVDARGFVYVADTSAGTVTQISPSGAAAALPFTFAKPAGLTVDSLNNLYVSDSAAQAVYEIDPITETETTLPLGTLAAPSGLAIDPAGNLLVADPGAAAIYRFNLQTATRTTVSTPATAPTLALSDAAGNLLIADTAAIDAVPASPHSSPFAVATLAPSALAMDAAGNLYTGTSAGAILKLTRTQGFEQFGAAASPQTVNMMESGNQPYTASAFSQTDSTDYTLAPTASTDCQLDATGSGTLAPGGVCALTATYTPTTYATTSDTVTFNGNLDNAALSTPSAVELTLTGPASAPASTTTLSLLPSSPVYGQTITLSAIVAGAAGSTLPPLGSVTFMVDNTPYTATLNDGTATTNVTGLHAGTHTVAAAYASSNGFAASSSSTATLTIAQATPVVTWPTPAAIPYGTALSAAQLKATSNVAGSFTYTPPAGTVLNAGTQTLSVLFTPADSTDYASVTATTQLVVNKASSMLALAAMPNPATQGRPETLTASVTGAGQPAGNVIFTSGSTILCSVPLNASGVALCAFTPSASGTLPISAQYQGDANHLASSAALSLPVYDTALRLQFASTTLTYPGATNLTACVTGATRATPTGTVQILDGTAVLATLRLQGNGCAYWYISPGLAAGAHTISAVYSGDRNNPAGASAPTLLTVNPVPVRMSVACWNSSFPYGTDYQCTVNVSSKAGAAQGSITYSYDAAAAVSVPLSGGNARFTLSRPPAGHHSVAIAYPQQTNYAAAPPQTETFSVEPAPVYVALTPSSWYASAGTAITFQAAVKSSSAGAPNGTGSVAFYDGSTLLATVPVNSSGEASFTTTNLPAARQKITATYSGGVNYGSGSTAITITIANNTASVTRFHRPPDWRWHPGGIARD